MSDIDSLIAAARERHVMIPRLRKGGLCAGGHRYSEPWPCPDRLLIDALAPVYEALRDIASRDAPRYWAQDEARRVLALERNPR